MDLCGEMHHPDSWLVHKWITSMLLHLSLSICLNVSGEYAQTHQQGLSNQQTTMVYTQNSIADTPRYDWSPMGDCYNWDRLCCVFFFVIVVEHSSVAAITNVQRNSSAQCMCMPVLVTELYTKLPSSINFLRLHIGRLIGDTYRANSSI